MSRSMVIGLVVAGVAAAGYAAYRFGIRNSFSVPGQARRAPKAPPPPGASSLSSPPGESNGASGFPVGGVDDPDWQKNAQPYVDEYAAKGLEDIGVPSSVAESGYAKTAYAAPLDFVSDVGDWIGL